MSKISRSLRTAWLVLLVTGAADARLLDVSHASTPNRHEPIGFTARSPQAKFFQTSSSQASSSQAKSFQPESSRLSDGVTWATQRLGQRSYWYASNGTTCLAQRVAETVIIRCY